MHQLSRRQLLGAPPARPRSPLALAGCGSDDDADDAKDLSGNRDGAMDKYGVGEQFKATEPLSFSIMLQQQPGLPVQGRLAVLSRS